MFKFYHQIIQKQVHRLQNFVGRVWYPPLISILAFLDNLILIVPTDGLLISSCLLKPQRWKSFALLVSIGSTLGAFLLFLVVQNYGISFLNFLYPDFAQAQAWVLTEKFFHLYGLVVIFIVSMTPVPQQPAIVLAGLSDVPVNEMLALLFLGRLIKFYIMAYAGSKAPGLIKKMWGIQGELHDLGLDIEHLKSQEIESQR